MSLHTYQSCYETGKVQLHSSIVQNLFFFSKLSQYFTKIFRKFSEKISWTCMQSRTEMISRPLSVSAHASNHCHPSALDFFKVVFFFAHAASDAVSTAITMFYFISVKNGWRQEHASSICSTFRSFIQRIREGAARGDSDAGKLHKKTSIVFFWGVI